MSKTKYLLTDYHVGQIMVGKNCPQVPPEVQEWIRAVPQRKLSVFPQAHSTHPQPLVVYTEKDVDGHPKTWIVSPIATPGRTHTRDVETRHARFEQAMVRVCGLAQFGW